METQPDLNPRHADSGVGVGSAGAFPGYDPGRIAGSLTNLDPSGVAGGNGTNGGRAGQDDGRVAPTRPGGDVREFVADEIALEVSMTRNAAANRVAHAVSMTIRIPVVHALETGVLDLYREMTRVPVKTT